MASVWVSTLETTSATMRQVRPSRERRGFVNADPVVCRASAATIAMLFNVDFGLPGASMHLDAEAPDVQAALCRGLHGRSPGPGTAAAVAVAVGTGSLQPAGAGARWARVNRNTLTDTRAPPHDHSAAPQPPQRPPHGHHDASFPRTAFVSSWLCRREGQG